METDIRQVLRAGGGRQGQVQGKGILQGTEKRAQWNRGGDCFILMSATRQRQVQDKGKLQAKDKRAQWNRSRVRIKV